MAIGTSGRLVVELDPAVKKALHDAIKKNGMTFKEWLESKAKEDFPEVFGPTKAAKSKA